MPDVFTMYLLHAMRAASSDSEETCSFSSETRWHAKGNSSTGAFFRPASKMRIFGSGTPRLYRDLGYALFFWYLRARVGGGAGGRAYRAQHGRPPARGSGPWPSRALAGPPPTGSTSRGGGPLLQATKEPPSCAPKGAWRKPGHSRNEGRHPASLMGRNGVIGGLCVGFAFAAYAYSMRSVSQTGITSQEIQEFRERKERELK